MPPGLASAILKEEPPEPTQSGKNISPALHRVVKRCLEKDRENRFQTAKTSLSPCRKRLRRPVRSGQGRCRRGSRRGRPEEGGNRGVVVVLGAAGLFLWRRPKAGETSSGVRRIAVLPFENLGSPEDDYFADGVADEARRKLTSLPGLQVIARGSSTPYKKTTNTPKRIEISGLPPWVRVDSSLPRPT